MCRALGEKNAYRCDCDTSEKRQARRVAASARAEVLEKHTIAPPVSSVPLPTPQEKIEILEKEVRSALDEHAEHGGFYGITGEEQQVKYAELEQKITQIGALTAEIAEKRLGYSLEDFGGAARALRIEVAEDELVWSRNNFDRDYKAYLDAKDYRIDSAIRKKMSDGVELSQEEKEYQAKKEQLHEKSERARQILHAKMDTLNEVKNLSPEEREKLTALSQEYLKELKEVRKFGDEMKLNIHERATSASQKRAQKIVESQLGHFPADWVEKANSTPFVIRESASRAHYSSLRGHSYQPLGRQARVRIMTKDEIERSNARPDTQITKLSEEDAKAWAEAKGTPILVSPDEEIVEIKHYHLMPYAPATGKKGKGWVKVEDRTGEEVWAKDITRYDGYTYYAAEVTIPKASAKDYKNDEKIRNEVDSTAIHEFSHRCESTSVGHIIPKLQQKFLERRTVDENGNREELTSIYADSKKEKGYRDSFSSHYIGKVYEHENREVLSMGMEMLFKNKLNGMTRIGTGVTGKGADTDYRNFILGMLRTV